MEKSSNFLKSLLAIDFNEPFAYLLFDINKQYITYFVNDMCEQILENMEFDLSIKKQTITFYYKCNNRLINFDNRGTLFDHCLKNINILSSS